MITGIILLALCSTPTQIDISAKLTSAEASEYTFKTSITTTHERSHLINAKESKHGLQAIYLGKNKFLKLPWPSKVKLSDIAARVPEDKKGFRYKTYLVDQAPDRWQEINGQTLWIRGRENNPLYLLDEFQSYVHGAVAGLEEASQGIYLEHRTDQFLAPTEMYQYVLALQKALQDLEPDYLTKHPELGDYIKNVKKTVEDIAAKAQKDPKLKWSY